MRRILVVVAVLTAVHLAAPRSLVPRLWAAALLQDSDDSSEERIRAFDSHITVSPDGSMEVTETIKVQAAGVNIRHGIYRDFPTRYKDRLGNNYSVGFDIVGVQRDGSEEAYHTELLRNGERVYFGKANYELTPGVYTYKFTYRTSRQLGFFKDHDELYWNVTGLGWMFPIDLATATVVLPPNVRGQVQEAGGYTGYEGEKGTAFTTARDEQGNPTFRAANLLPHQGLTLVVTWPKGLVHEPTAAEKRQQLLADNRPIAIGVGGLVLVWLYYILVWFEFGRDPRPGTIVPLYEPQDNLSAAGMRFLERMGFDDKVFTSGILGLAAKGYLTIERDGKTYKLLRKRGYGTVESGLSADEKSLAQKLFSNGDKVSLTEHNALLQSTQKALQTTLHDVMEKKYFVTNGRFQWPGVILTLLTVLVMVLEAGGAGTGIFMSIWLTGWSVGVAVLLAGVFRAWKSVIGGSGSVTAAVFITLFSLPFVGGECVGFFFLESSVGVVPIFIILAGVLTSVFFHYLLKAPTLAGRALMDRVEGFRMFLSAVDGDRMNRMTAPPAKTPELFERFLPYALALGVEHAWAQQFSQVLAAAAGASAQGGRGYAPSWYSGTGFSTFSAAAFTSSFSDSFSGAVSSASAAAPSSSGSGGGGSSGGGGGGGGGGGW